MTICIFLTGHFQTRPAHIVVQIHIFSLKRNFWSNLSCILDTGEWLLLQSQLRLCGCSLRFVRPSVRRLPSPTSALSPSSQSGSRGLPSVRLPGFVGSGPLWPHFPAISMWLYMGALGSVLVRSVFGVPHCAGHGWIQLWKKLDCRYSLTFIQIHIPESLCESSAHPKIDITAIRWGLNPTAEMSLKKYLVF